MARRRTLITVAVLSTTVFAAFGLVGQGTNGARLQALAQTQPSAPPAVKVASPLTREVVEWREFAGRFEPSAAVEVRARVSGHLQSIGFEDGEIVEAGSLLFAIDPRPYHAALDEARAQLASAAAHVELADLELRRAEQLVDRNAVSQATLDQRRQQKKAAGAARDLAEAAVKRAEIELSFTEVRAPFSGRVSNRRLDVGALVTDGAMLTTLVALDPVYFVFDISEQDLLAYQQAARSGALPAMHGQQIPIEARAQTDTDWPHKGTIDFVDNRLEAGAGTIRARANLSNAGGLVTPGQFGRVRLPFSVPYEAMLVPETALLTDQAQRVLLAVEPDGTVRSAKVDLGPRQPDGLRIVRSGVRPDDRIVVSGLSRARAGQKVTAQPADPQLQAAAFDTASGR